MCCRAVLNANIDICNLLLNSMCKINSQSSDGFTALHYAILLRKHDICKLLLNHRVKVHIESHKGFTALALAIHEHLPELCLMLLESGYNINKCFAWSETPLEMSIRLHTEKCSLTLLRWGCKVNFIVIKKGKTYFDFAAEEGLTTAVQMLGEINPLFLNERWVKMANFPLALQGIQTVQDWLLHSSTQPMSLMKLCRSKIHNYVGRQAPLKIERLPLPHSIKLFLSWNEYFPADFYTNTQQSLLCPWECKSVCSELACPSLDKTIKDHNWHIRLLNMQTAIE